MITENAITLADNVQIITFNYGIPDIIRKDFDFEHCKPYYESFTDRLFMSREQYDLNMNMK